MKKTLSLITLLFLVQNLLVSQLCSFPDDYNMYDVFYCVKVKQSPLLNNVTVSMSRRVVIHGTVNFDFHNKSGDSGGEIRVDFADGLGYRTVAEGNITTINYTSGTHTIKVQHGVYVFGTYIPLALSAPAVVPCIPQSSAFYLLALKHLRYLPLSNPTSTHTQKETSLIC